MPGFLCQLSGKVITKPVIYQGFIYDREALRVAIEQGVLSVDLDIRNDTVREQFLLALIKHCSKKSTLSYQEFEQLYSCPLSLAALTEKTKWPPVLCTVDGYTYNGKLIFPCLEKTSKSPFNQKPILQDSLIQPELALIIKREFELIIKREFEQTDKAELDLDFLFGTHYRFSIPSLTPRNRVPEKINNNFLKTVAVATSLEMMASIYFAISHQLMSTSHIVCFGILQSLFSAYLLYRALRAAYLVNQYKAVDFFQHPAIYLASALLIISDRYFSSYQHDSALPMQITFGAPSVYITHSLHILTCLRLRRDISKLLLQNGEYIFPAAALSLFIGIVYAKALINLEVSYATYAANSRPIIIEETVHDLGVLKSLLSTIATICYAASTLPCLVFAKKRYHDHQFLTERPSIANVLIALTTTLLSLSALHDTGEPQLQALDFGLMLFCMNLIKYVASDALSSLVTGELAPPPVGLRYRDLSKQAFWENPDRAPALIDNAEHAGASVSPTHSRRNQSNGN